MSFDLPLIAIFIAFAVGYALILPARARGWALLIASVVAIYVMQPPLPIRFSDFIFPTVTLALTVGAWYLTRPPEHAVTRGDLIALGVIVALVIALSLNRFVDVDARITPSRPPEPLAVLIGLALAGGVTWIAGRAPQRSALNGMFALIVVVFIALKTEPFGTAISGVWRGATVQDTTLAALIDLNWLGFSYVAFRLIHTLRDRLSGLLPDLTLREYVTYVIFAPAYVAGPIDRAERFVSDDRALATLDLRAADRWYRGGSRIAVGIFKKFVIADTLALFALNSVNVDQAVGAGALWLLLYAYAFRLFFDFSGYTDIAIGIGILLGFQLPENFDRPYTRANITLFWQSWHMTLSAWARFYIFSPLSRALLRRQPKPSPTLIVLSTQMATMVVIGLWHGIMLNFLVWGIWHGIGLFAHKQWSDRTRKWYRGLNDTPARKRAWTVFAWFITFQFVVLGWVWFALPDFGTSARMFGRLFGIGW